MIKIIGLAILTMIALTLFFIFNVSSNIDLGSEYQYVRNRADDFYIKKNNRLVIRPTIIDLRIISNYIIGLQLQADYLECDHGDSYKIRVSNNRRFFIINKTTDDIMFFDTEESFNQKRISLNIQKNSILDYAQFEKVWNYYSKAYLKIDFSTCKQMLPSTSKHKL